MRAFPEGIVVEFSGTEIYESPYGSLVARVGEEGRTITYAYQAEEWIKHVLPNHLNIKRIYLFHNNEIIAIFTNNPNGDLNYLWRHHTYDGKWELPFVDQSNPRIHKIRLDSITYNFSQAQEWADRLCEKGELNCLVMSNEGKLAAAWEKGPDGKAVLVAMVPENLKELTNHLIG